jgi:DNA polymerase-3 subunit epsilon
LPERPGVFVFEGDDDDKALHMGRAANLRRDVKRYFRLDRDCARAVALSHRLTRIRWQVASGPLDARLREIALRNEASADATQARRSAVSICIDPAATPVARLVDLAGPPDAGELFGIYATERKAANALRKLTRKQQVCQKLLGLTSKSPCACGECIDAAGQGAAARLHRAKHLLRLMSAISPLRLQPWPYPGAIAIREGRSVHVFDRWEYLGTVRTGSDMHALLQMRRNGFDPRIYQLLTRVLPRLGPRALRNIPAPARVQLVPLDLQA